MVYYSHGDGGPVGSYDVSDDLISRVTMGRGAVAGYKRGGGWRRDPSSLEKYPESERKDAKTRHFCRRGAAHREADPRPLLGWDEGPVPHAQHHLQG